MFNRDESFYNNKMPLERKDVDLGEDLVGWLLKDFYASESFCYVLLDGHRIWAPSTYGEIPLPSLYR